MINNDVIYEVVKNELGKSEITMDDILSVEKLDFTDKNIDDFIGLTIFANLSEINLSGNPITSVSFLRDLKNLTNINICCLRDIQDMDAIKGLHKMKKFVSNIVINLNFLSEWHELEFFGAVIIRLKILQA